MRKTERITGSLRDLRFAIRGLRRRPGFATAAILTLALGIGTSVAMFSVAYGVTLRPLPYNDPARLIRIYESNLVTSKSKEDVSIGAFDAWRKASTLESAALFSKPVPKKIADRDDYRLSTMGVSPTFFKTLGVPMLAGPGFRDESTYTYETAKEAVISFQVWKNLFQSRPDVIGQSIAFETFRANEVLRIVGVLPEKFIFVPSVEIWQPYLVMSPVPRVARTWRYEHVIARLKPGQSADAAMAELQDIAAGQARDFPASNKGWSVTVESLRDSIVGSFGRVSWLLMAAVALVLMVACLNICGLLTARAVSRAGETTLRVALGADRSRLLQLWLSEALVLSIIGGAVGLALARAGVAALKSVAPAEIPRLDAVRIDGLAVSITIVAVVLSGIAFTLAPLTLLSRARLAGGLRDRSVGALNAARSFVNDTLTAAQCAGATVLVVVAVLLTMSFSRLSTVRLGYDPADVWTFTVTPPKSSEPRPWFRRVEWSDNIIAGLMGTTGVERVALTTQVPLAPNPYSVALAKGRGRLESQDLSRWAAVEQKVTDDYFSLMGIHLREGRLFAAVDRFSEPQINQTQSAESGTAIITKETAATLWPGESALGKELWLPDTDNVSWRTVIGVVDDIQFSRVGEAPGLQVFLPFTQTNGGTPRLMVHFSRGQQPQIATFRSLVTSIEPGTDVIDVVSLPGLVSRATAQPRFASLLMSIFSIAALVLAAVGIYGTLAFVINSRLPEIAVRLALGASRRRILGATFWSGFRPALTGILVGAGATLVFSSSLKSLLFETAPRDLLSFILSLGLLLLVAVAAALGPAWRASRTDPVRLLRAD